jgi:predicted ATPase/Tfp pilus assembly protein PilF
VVLPAGTVTFVFTDVEGSTRLLGELGGEAYAAALREHRRALRCAFASGYEVDTQGDAFFFAFERATDAVSACRNAVAALEGGTIRVRIGLHTGEAVLTDEGYVGVDVHRAARIAGVAHGGQIVASRTTRELVPEGDFVDLGEHRLKDLTRPEHLFQLGLVEFPPLRSLNLVNLPLQPTPLVGRTAEVTAATGLVRGGARLVSLTGPGGSGKTRLALQVAAELADEFPDGVWFVPLQSVDRPELVPLAVSSALGIEGAPAEWLRTRKSLLVVDNLEHLLPGAADTIRELLTAEGVCVLATSRVRLALAAEHELAVDPMELAEGAELFVTRARQLGVSLDRSPTVEEIVRAVDALPLAIELAAARARIMAVEEIRDRLGAPLELLRGGGSLDSPERHQTLRATIEWSVDLLGPDERESFARLAVFRGSFDLDAGEQVASAGLDALSALVDKSLLRRTAEGRLFMLETLQQYARELFVDRGDRDEIERRHALLMSQRVADPADDPRAWRRRIEAEYADIRAALGWLDEHQMSSQLIETTLALRAFWDSRELAEGRHWLERALAHISDPASADACTITCALAHLAWRQGDWPAAETWADQAIAGAEALGELDTAAYALSTRGAIAWFSTGDTARAVKEYERALELARKSENTRYIATFTNDLAMFAFAEGRLADAEARAEESLEAARAAHAPALEANAFTTLADVRIAQNDRAAARTLAHRALAMEREEEVPDVTLAESLVRLSALAVEEDAELASLLVGARDNFVTQSGMAIEPTSIKQRDETVEKALSQLGATKTADALASGGRLTLAEAVDLALERVSPPATDQDALRGAKQPR